MIFKIKHELDDTSQKLFLLFNDIRIELTEITINDLKIDTFTDKQEDDLTTEMLKENKLHSFLIDAITRIKDTDKKNEALKALITIAEPEDLKSIFSRPGFLQDSLIQKPLAEAIKELNDPAHKKKVLEALGALIKIADNTQLKKIFEQPNFLSNCNQAFSDIINDKNIGNPLKRKTIKVLGKIKGNDDEIAKIMIAALDVEDSSTKNEAICFFKEYHKEVDANLITDLVNTSNLEKEFKEGLYVDKTKMRTLNTLLKKFDNQEKINGRLEKAEEYLKLMGHGDFDKRQPNLDLLSKVPNNIKELTKKESDDKPSALNSIQTVVDKIKDDEQKKFVLELFFGKHNPAASKNIPATIGVNDIEKFINIYGNKLTDILLKIDYKDPDDVNFYKEYIKADFINTIPNNEKPGGGLFSRSSWGYSRSFFDSGNMRTGCFPSSTTKKNNDKFLEEILEIKNIAIFQGTSSRKKDGILCNNNAIKQIVQEYAACSSESSKREYRQAFYQVLSDLKCATIKKETKRDWGWKIKAIELNDPLTIPCSQDQLHLLVHAKIANFRYGYSQNELAKIIKEIPETRLTSEINNYCTKHEESLLNRKEENLNILCIKTSPNDNIGLISGGLGGATRYMLNSFVFSPLRKFANLASYNKPNLPNFSIAQPDGRTLVNPKEVEKQ